ncbi:MAG: right-handed parallel beta-helix repeat-containing protein [Verrucomicrobiales bacterium]
MNHSASIRRFLFLAAASLVALMCFAFSQGTLTPPGAPAPTMKTLQQIEPRIDLATVAGDADYHHVIAQAGSYYLTGNLVVSKTHGILIGRAGVTLDLNGFQIVRSSGTGGNAITVSSLAHRCTVKNGTIGEAATPSFGYGVQGVNTPSTPRGGTLLQLAVFGCSITGLRAGIGWEITGCEVHDNADGISSPGGSTITRCTASTNSGRGISVSSSTIHDCTAYDNGGDGIAGLFGSTITGCTARLNGDDGIVSQESSTIIGCTAFQNTGDGIEFDDSCFVQGNNCSRNGSNGDGAGIHSTGTGNRIEGNLVYQNDRGIDADVGQSLIIKNSATGNVINYALAANNKVGVIVIAPNSALINGNTGGAGVGSTDPWANFSY